MLFLLTTVFLASLIGSLHCAGMCGPLAMIASGTQSSTSSIEQRKPRWSLIAGYHLGRITSYAAIGLIAGSLGTGIHHTGTVLGLQRLAAQFAGGTMLVIGLLALVRLASGQRHSAYVPKRFQEVLHRAHIWAREQPPLRRATVIGVLTAILPCGWLYAFILFAAGTASAATGSLVMIAFGLGSVPAMTVLVAGATTLFGNYQRWIPWASAILVASTGLYTLSERAHADLTLLHHSRSETSKDIGKSKAPSTLAEQIEKIRHEELPCCEDR